MLRSYLGYKWKKTGTEVGFRSVILVLMVKNSPIFNLKTGFLAILLLIVLKYIITVLLYRNMF